MKNEGLIKKIGVSLNSNEEIEDVLNCNHIDLIQLPFNLLDNNNQRKKTLIKAKEKGVEIDGIRIYMGVYPDEEKYLEKAGMTTLFIVPTSDFKVSSGGISLQKSADSKDITGIDYLNYGSSGLPPEIIFPH